MATQLAGSGTADLVASFTHPLPMTVICEPADDLLSALTEARDGQDRLTEVELTSMAQLLFIAGHDTTVSLIANGVLALLTNPAQLTWVRADRSRWPAAVEELLRFDSPVQVPIPVATTEPVEIAGRTIPAGEHVIVSLMAANRDPARFPDRRDWTSPARTATTWPSATASTSVSAHPWPGWRAASH